MSEQVPGPVHIPADVELPDKVLAGLTARQVLILAVGAGLLYVGWVAARGWVPGPVLAGLAVPVVLVTVGLAIGRRDGLTMDRFAWAALRHLAVPTRLVVTGQPEHTAPVPAWITRRAISRGNHRARVAPLVLPLGDITDTPTAGTAAMVGLGGAGIAVVAACSTVNFSLRTPTEQQALVSVFARWLHALTSPVQVLVRAEQVDLSGYVADLLERAPTLPHPALEQAALDHAEFLTGLAEHTDLLRRQVLLVLRDPAPGAKAAAAVRLSHQVEQARRILAPAGITVTVLDAAAAAAVLTAACDPATARPAVTPARWASPSTVITTAPEGDTGDGGEPW